MQKAQKERSVKVLVVDDDQRIVKTTCDILKIKGHLPIAAYSGEEGVEKARAEAPDCVLMDIKMGGIDGVAAMKQMHLINPSLPVILISAYATDDLLQDAKHSGAYAILSKPINFQVILTFLELFRKEESILVVDDDPAFCRTLQDILTLRGFHVETEEEPGKVLEDIESERKLVVVLDLNLGSVSGVEVLRRIRTKYPALPVVLVTGYRHEMGDAVEKAFEIGAYTCLYKPFEMDALFQVVEEIRLKKLKNLLVTA